MNKLLIFCVLCISVFVTGCIYDCIDDYANDDTGSIGSDGGYEPSGSIQNAWRFETGYKK